MLDSIAEKFIKIYLKSTKNVIPYKILEKNSNNTNNTEDENLSESNEIF